MKYQNVKNGQIGTVVDENKKFKTVTLEMEDGTSRSYSLSTIKRWWKEVPDEELAGDGTPYKQVLKEIIQDEEKHVKEVMKQKKELGIKVTPIKEVTVVEENGKKVNKKLKLNEIEDIKKGMLDVVSRLGIQTKEYDPYRFGLLDGNGKQRCVIIAKKQKGLLLIKSKDAPKNSKPDSINEKHPYDYRFNFTVDEMDKLEKLIPIKEV